MASIGSLNEKSLHVALKAWCLQPGDQTEVPVDGYIIDIVRGDLLIEVQTRNFSEEHFFENPKDLEFLIPTNLSDTFTTTDLANALNTSRRFAQKMAYCLDRMNLFTRIGKRGNAIVYRRSNDS